MPVRGRCLLLVAVAGFALGAGPAVGAKHRRARLIATKARAHGHVPALPGGRPPLVGTLPGPSSTPTASDPVPTTPTPSCPTALGVSEGNSGTTYYTRVSRATVCPGPITIGLHNDGEDDHDLKIVDLDHGTVVATWSIAHPGEDVQKHLTLVAGTYRLSCTLSDGNGVHDDLGMHAVIVAG
jgi:hypothetical protein